MKKIVIAALILMSSVLAFANQNAQGYCTVGGQRVNTVGMSSTGYVMASYPGCIVTVRNVSDNSLATIYSDNLSTPTPLVNPFTSTAQGSWLFYASYGRYNITLSGGGLSASATVSDVILQDLTMIHPLIPIVSAPLLGTNSSGQIVLNSGTIPNNTSGNAATASNASQLLGATWATPPSAGYGSTTPEPVNATTMTAQESITSLSPVADVRAYGGTCNRSADDTAAFQAVVNALATTGGTVLSPNCTINAAAITFPTSASIAIKVDGAITFTSQPLTVRNGIDIIGITGATSPAQFATGTAAMLNCSPTSVCLEYNGLGSVPGGYTKLKNIQITPHTTAPSIDLNAANFMKFENVQLQGQSTVMTMESVMWFDSENSVYNVTGGSFPGTGTQNPSTGLGTNPYAIHYTIPAGPYPEGSNIRFHRDKILTTGILIDATTAIAGGGIGPFKLDGVRYQSGHSPLVTLATLNYGNLDSLEISDLDNEDNQCWNGTGWVLISCGTSQWPLIYLTPGYTNTIGRLDGDFLGQWAGPLVNPGAPMISSGTISGQPLGALFSMGGQINIKLDTSGRPNTPISPTTIPYATLPINAWGGTFTTVTGPDGLASGAAYTSAAEHDSVLWALPEASATVGDWFIFGGWVQGAGTQKYGTCGYQIDDFSSTGGAFNNTGTPEVTALTAGQSNTDKGWYFVSTAAKLTTVGTGGTISFIATGPGGGFCASDATNYAYPFAVRIPASAGIPDAEVIRWKNDLYKGIIPASATAGSTVGINLPGLTTTGSGSTYMLNNGAVTANGSATTPAINIGVAGNGFYNYSSQMFLSIGGINTEQMNATSHAFGSGTSLSWTNATQPQASSASDTSLCRNSAGVVGVWVANNCTTPGSLAIGSHIVLPSFLVGYHGSSGGGDVQLSDGTGASGNCAKFDANGNLTDSGAACGSGSGGSRTVTGVTASLPIVSSGGTTPNLTFTWPAAIPSGTTIPYGQVTSQPTIPTSANWPGTVSCTNQFVSAIANGSTPTCSTINYSQLGGTVPTWNQSTTGNAATATNASQLLGSTWASPPSAGYGSIAPEPVNATTVMAQSVNATAVTAGTVAAGAILSSGGIANANGQVIPATAAGYTGPANGNLRFVGGAADSGIVNLVSGTATVSTAAACSSGPGCTYHLTNCGVRSSTALGVPLVGGASVGSSFIIYSGSATNTAVAGDVSTICWAIN